MSAEQQLEADIWVVDGSAMGRRLIARVLQGRGHRVSEFATAVGVTQALGARRCDCLLTTLRSEGVDGLDLIAGLRDVYTPAELPIILLATDATDDDMRRAAALGVAAWLKPPVPPQILCEVVHAQLL